MKNIGRDLQQNFKIPVKNTLEVVKILYFHPPVVSSTFTGKLDQLGHWQTDIASWVRTFFRLILLAILNELPAAYKWPYPMETEGLQLTVKYYTLWVVQNIQQTLTSDSGTLSFCKSFVKFDTSQSWVASLQDTMCALLTMDRKYSMEKNHSGYNLPLTAARLPDYTSDTGA